MGPSLLLYAPYVGASLMIFGIVRVLIRSEVDFSNMGPTSLRTSDQNAESNRAIWRALFSKAGRFDLCVIAAGFIIILFFVASLG